MDTNPVHGLPQNPGTPLDQSGVSRRRPLLWLVLAFCLGIVLDDLIQSSQPTVIGCFLASVLIFVITVFQKKTSQSALQVFLFTGVLASISGGMTTHALGSRFPSSGNIARRTAARASLYWIEGTLVEVRQATSSGSPDQWTVDVELLGAEVNHLTAASGYIRVSAKPPAPQVWEADRIRMLALIEPPLGATLPASFDHAQYLMRNGINRVGTVQGIHVEEVGQASWLRWNLWLRRWGGQIAAKIETRLGPEKAGVINALLLGRLSSIANSDREAFAKAGTAHLLSISGLHIHALAGLLWWILGRVGMARRKSGFVILGFVAGYAALAGAQPSVLRAALMIGVYIGAIILRRPLDPLSSLAAAAGIILSVHPGHLFLAGFQLSFLAVVSLVTLYPTFETAWLSWRGLPELWIVDPDEQPRLRLEKKVRASLFVSLSAWIGTAPVVAWHMGYFAYLSIFTNFIAIPLALVALVCGVGCILALLPGLSFLMEPFSIPSTLLLGFNRLLGEANWISMDVQAPHSILLLACAVLLIWIWVGKGRYTTFPRLSVITAVACLSLLVPGIIGQEPQNPRVTILDLPRGRASLIETPTGEVALVDCGGEGQGRRIAESLRRQHIRSIALLVVSQDRPEALGGLLEILERVTVHKAFLPRSAVPSGLMREVEQSLRDKKVPFFTIRSTETLKGPGDLVWHLASDVVDNKLPRYGSESLFVRVQLPGSSVLFANARSNASLQKILQASATTLKSDILRLTSGPGGRWPSDTTLLIDRCGAQTVIAGQGRDLPEEGLGVDLAELAATKGFRLLSPRREGSLRLDSIERDTFTAYRGGRWEPVQTR